MLENTLNLQKKYYLSFKFNTLNEHTKKILGVNLTVQDLLRQDSRIQDLYFNISEMKLSITSVYIISDASKYNIIWTENSDVIDSFIKDIF